MLASRASWMVFGLILVFLATISLLLLPVSIAALEPTPDPCGETGPLAPTFQPPTNMPGVSPTLSGGSNGTVTPAESAVHPCATQLPPSDTATLAPRQVLSTLIGSPGTRMPLVRSSPSLTRSPTRSKTPTATVTPSTTPTSGQVRALTTGCASTTRWTVTYDFGLQDYRAADTFIEGWERRVPSKEGKYTDKVGWQVDLEQGTGRVVLQANLKRAVHIIHISAVLDYRPAGEGFHQAAFYVPPQMPAIAAAWATGGVFTLHWSGDRTDISQLEVNIWAGTGTATIHSVTIDGYGEMLDGTCPPPVSNCPGAWQRTYDFGASDGGWVTRDINEGSYQAGVGWQTANVGTQRVVIEHAVRADKITRVTAIVDYNPGGGDFQQAVVYVPDYGSTSNSATRLVSATTTGNGLNLTWPASGLGSRVDITVLQVNIWAGPSGSAVIRSVTIEGEGYFEGQCSQPTATPTPTLTPTPTNTPTATFTSTPDLTQTAIPIQTAIAGNGCVVKVAVDSIPLMSDLLNATLVQIPRDTPLIADQGRGRLQSLDYTYVRVSYGNQQGWIYSAGGNVTLLSSSGQYCKDLPLVRLDYQVPSLQSPSSSPLYYNQNQALTCNDAATAPVQAQCTYNSFVNQFIATYNRVPTMKDLLKVTIQGEWWAFRLNQAQGTGRTVQADASEGLSRAYYASCTRGVCTPDQLFTFLSGYQPWLLGNATPDTVAAARVQHYAQALQAGAAMDAMVDEIFNPSPNDPTGQQPDTNWATAGKCDRPWQWFTYDQLNGSGRTIGLASNQIYDRFLNVPQSGWAFEIFTLRQTPGVGC